MPGWVKNMMGLGLTGPQATAINGDAQVSQTATGSTQATAFQIVASSTEFTTVAASTGAVLPPVVSRITSGDIAAIYNQGASTLTVYPPVGGRIGLAAVNAGVSVASGKSALFGARGDGNYFAFISA